MQKFSDVIFNHKGRPVPDLRVVVDPYVVNAAPNLSAASSATIYAVDGGPVVQSVKSDADGRFSFYAADGRYNLTVTGAGIAPYMLADLTLNDISDEAMLRIDVDAISARLNRQVSPMDAPFNAKGDGVVDDTTAFAAWSAAVSLCGIGYVPSGVYNLPNGFTPPQNATVICAKGAVFDLSKGSDGAIGAKAYGSIGTGYALTATPALYGNTLALSSADAANFAAEDYAEVYSSDLSDIAARTDTPIGEIVKISAVSGGTITLYGNLKVPNLYTTTPRLRKITFFEDLTWHGGEFRGRTTGAGPAQIGFYGKWARNINTYGVFMNQTMGIGHLWESSLNCWAINSTTVDNRKPTVGYSVACGYTAQFCGARGGDFVRSRHAFTTTGGTSGFGIPINCGIYGARSRYATGDDYDTHSIGIDIDILDCISEYCGGSAVNIECQSAKVRVKAIKPAQHGIAISNYARAPGEYDIEMDVTDATISILRLDAGTLPASQYGIGLLNAKFTGSATSSAVDVSWSSSAPMKAENISLRGNVKSATSGNAVLLSYCKDPDVSNLKVTCSNVSASAFKFDHCDGGSADGAQGDLPSGSSGASFFINVSNNIDLRGARGRSPAAVNSKGITVDSSSSNCQFGDIANRFIGHTTALNAGLGTGHTGSTSGSAVYDPPSLAAGAKQQTNVTVSGANVGDQADVAFSVSNVNIRWSAEVTLANTVTVTQENLAASAIDMASGTLKVQVSKIA